MPRRKKAEFVRDVGLDPVFGSRLIQKLINVVMWRGKKTVARKIVYDAMDIVLQKNSNDKKKALEYFQRAFERVIPHVEVRSRRVGGSVYQVPRPVHAKRQEALALRWFISAAKKRPGKTMGERLGHEILDAAEDRGNAVRMRADVHKMAEANRAFSHYAW